MLLVGAILGACSDDGDLETVVECLVSDGSIRLEEDGSASVVLAADCTGTDESPDYEIVDQPTLGELVGSGSVYEYIPDENANGQDQFTFRAVVGDGQQSDLATITVFIDAVNDAPRGTAGLLVIDEDEEDAGGPLQASDVEGDPLTFSLVQAPEFGRVDISTDGQYTYTPDRNFVGNDTFLWAATDDSNASTGPVRIDITVGAANDVPVVSDNGFVGAEDEVLSGELFGTDPDGDELIWRVVTQPTNGDLSLNTNFGTFTYTPDPNFFGADSFEVAANDGFVDSEPGTVDITITAVDDPPTVSPAVLTTDEDTALIDTVAAVDVEGQPISFRIGEPPRNGIVSINATTGEFSYTPNANVNGTDDFTVIASDLNSDSLPARIVVNITPVNDVPRLQNIGLLTTDEDMIVTGAVTGTDPEGDTLIFSVFSAPTNGSVEVSPVTGALAYTPTKDFNGNDQFAIVATDGAGDSDPAFVDVLIRPVNDAPVPNPVSLSTITGAPAQATLSADDPEGDTLFYLIAQQPNNGTAIVDAASGVVTVTPDPGFNGSDVLVWQVTDGQLSTNGVLPITVGSDSDGDGIADDADNCPDIANADQDDVSGGVGNGVGDVCDCYEIRFAEELDEDIWANSFAVSNQTNQITSETHALRFNGGGSFVETVALPGCSSFLVQVQVEVGPPAPEVGDALRFLARFEGDTTWTEFARVDGTGLEEPFSLLEVQTSETLDLSGGNVEFRIEVVGDELNDLFFIDDLLISCDEDSDFLVDCVESGLDNYDLTEADGDGDGLNDAGEFEKGTDPNVPDSDFDGINDLLDNCPLTQNPGQEDDDGDGIGNACSVFGFYDDFDASTVLDATNWSSGSAPTPLWTGSQFASNPGPIVPPFGVNAEEVGGVDLISQPYDFSNCTDAAVNFYVHNRDAEGSGDELFVQYSLDGGTTWTLFPNGTITEFDVGRGLNSPFTPFISTYSDPVSIGSSFQVRFNNGGSAPTVDRYYVDSVAIDCDNDADGLANVMEKDVLGSNLSNADSDGDGTPDGDAFLNGDLVVP